MFPTPQSWAKHRVMKITEIASLCPKNGTEYPPAYKTLFFFLDGESKMPIKTSEDSIAMMSMALREKRHGTDCTYVSFSYSSDQSFSALAL